ncbi:helix-turn-helix transcriptional regulator [Salmonella enterica subsp. enterica serovar Ealing]|nr:XRE family transcriptional regulator [Salmonella enterica subsp. enterica serovar Adelaide]EDU1332057.1 helix-turn-helix transcriptional regulator [Salmonella enterica subsp. enterica serovar Braenderup]EDX6360988.1 helix-turn-helix transcriptional regulator [Salmonella enterica subsp. enterica serovar Ealing]EHW1576382.1 helix-turn-helix transcriptional regulator [Salmonella enterica]EJE2188534.1 helix-turn-helix transcriptional regulator [Salmonella enterica]
MKIYIGARLREERERVGLSQPEMGEVGGVTKLTQLNYEKGERMPDAAYLSVLHESLGIDVSYILTGQRTPTPEGIVTVSQEEKALLKNYRAMDKAAQLNMQAVSAAFAQANMNKDEILKDGSSE